ncbi:MAG: PilZ domain-containing protein [Pseudobutyrivibrio sp.]|nr:PilZ domain-containing protein [Pseudobutyrivibrio sp.]
MTIEQLKAGQEVTLEVIIGDSSFEIKTDVVGTNAGTGALVKPYIYNGQVVDFTKGSPKSLSFSLHCIDSKTKGRVVWKNVSVNLVKFKNVDYYVIDTKAFGSIAASSERREDTRVMVNNDGMVIMEEGNSFRASVIDISDSGISFIASDRSITIGDKITVEYSDVAHGSDFMLSIECKIVRVEANNRGILYAGKIQNKDKKLLAYLCFKGMDVKVEEKTKENRF